MVLYSLICLYNLQYTTLKSIFVCVKACYFALLKDTDLCKYMYHVLVVVLSVVMMVGMVARRMRMTTSSDSVAGSMLVRS